MDLLETVLRAANAEKYVKNLRNNSIDSYTLKVLNEEDLKILGIDDEEIRKSIVEHAKNLQIPSEKKIDLVFDDAYIKTVFDQMNDQLKRQIASLACANLREDVAICDIPLSPAVKTLNNCILSLEKEIDIFEDKILPTKKKKRRTRNVLLPTLIVAATATLIIAIFYRKQTMYSISRF